MPLAILLACVILVQLPPLAGIGGSDPVLTAVLVHAVPDLARSRNAEPA